MEPKLGKTKAERKKRPFDSWLKRNLDGSVQRLKDNAPCRSDDRYEDDRMEMLDGTDQMFEEAGRFFFCCFSRV
jgi:hypothetical protein